MNIIMHYDINSLCEKVRKKVSDSQNNMRGTVTIDIITAKEIMDVLEEVQEKEEKKVRSRLNRRVYKCFGEYQDLPEDDWDCETKCELCEYAEECKKEKNKGTGNE